MRQDDEARLLALAGVLGCEDGNRQDSGYFNGGRRLDRHPGGLPLVVDRDGPPSGGVRTREADVSLDLDGARSNVEETEAHRLR